jgi:hypothetical protein
VATIALSIAGTVIGTAIGGPILGAVLSTAGAYAGGLIDSMLFPTKPQIIKQEGPRLTQQQVTTSLEGAVVKRLYGRARMSGQIIWATRFRETTTVTTTGGQSSGKSGRRQQQPTTQQTTYNYFCSFAIGLCEGPASQVGRIWADGKLLDQSLYTIRAYLGTDDQGPDPKISAVEGAGKTPAYRGLVYIVFDEMNLDKFGNRLPQITAEVIRPLASEGENTELIANAVAMKTGGEFLMGTTNFIKTEGTASSSANFINARNISSIEASLDDLQSVIKQVQTIDLRVSWFGNDLRCQQCRVRPKVEKISTGLAPLSVSPNDWEVSGMTRAGVAADTTPSDFILSVSQSRRYFQATPSDKALFEGIQAINARGLNVVFSPVLDMDIPVGNTTPSPYGSGTTPAYPDRRLLTCNPAIGASGTVDQTATATTQVDWFFGDPIPSNFGTWNGTTIPFTGSPGWGYRRMVLHYAKLCAAAGGVDAFNVGVGLARLTKIRGLPSSGQPVFPAANHMLALINEVKAILPSAKVSYAADWTEWNGHNPAEFASAPSASQWYETYYHHLDSVWTAADYVGIEWYPPLSDWRAYGAVDYQEGAVDSEYNQDYLIASMSGSEYYDYRYTSSTNRSNQIRTPILDIFAQTNWQFARKNLLDWWRSDHFNRTSGTVNGTKTSYVSKSKQIRFTSTGCPAINLGSNSPDQNPPLFSNQSRDDAIQRAYLEAVLLWALDPQKNPPIVGGSADRMVDNNMIPISSWDVRTYPEYPNNTTLFQDGEQYAKGFSLAGRVGSPALIALVKSIMEGSDVPYDVSELYGGNTMIEGYVLENITSLRELLAPLESCFFFDAIESEGIVKFALRIRRPSMVLTTDSLLTTEDNPGGYKITRNQESDNPIVVKLQYIDPARDYNTAAVDSRRLIGSSQHTEQLNYPLVLETFYAKIITDALLQEAWMKRETIDMELPPSLVNLDAGDLVVLDTGSGNKTWRINKITTGYGRSVQGFSYDESAYPATR